MRFQYGIGTSGAANATLRQSAPEVRAGLRPRKVRFERYAIAAATLLAIAGCASMDHAVTGWNVEPVVSVTHSMASSEGYYRMGRYYDGMGQWKNAVDAYRRAIGVDARHVDAHNALGVSLAQGGSYADAETVLRQALALAPTRADVRSNLGYVLMLAGRPEAAVTELRTALEVDGDNPVALANLREASARAAGGRPPEQTATVTQPSVDAAQGEVAEVPRHAAMQVNDRPTVGSLQANAMNLQPGSSALQSGFTAIESAAAPVRPAASGALASTVAAPSSLAVGHDDALLEVINGNGVSGMGARLRDWLARHGVRTSRLGNQRPFAQERTEIQYRAGHAGAAQRVADALPASLRVAPTPAAGLRSDVRVVLGRDWVHGAACLEHEACGSSLTRVALAIPPSSRAAATRP